MAAKSLHEFMDGETRFGKLTVVSEASKVASQRRVLCRCDCGAEKVVYAQHLKRGNSRSCGCEIKVGRPTHGKYYEAGYSRWNAMMSRCYHAKNKHFPDYGGRGISVCERWHDVRNFLEDMGNPPPGMSIDRIDHNGNYEPSNCRWATDVTQARNKRNARLVEWQGSMINVVKAAEITGLTSHQIYKRLRRGWSDHDALTVPIKARHGESA